MEKDVIFYNGFKFTRYPNSKNWSESRYYSGWVLGKKKRLHRYKYECEVGDVGKDFHIHHIDENTLNNDISNLEKKCRTKHVSEHIKERVENNKEWLNRFHLAGIEAAKEWHKSKEGSEWHKEHAKKTGFGNFDYGKDNCEECKEKYLRKTKSARFCSNKCKSESRRKSGVDNEKRLCKKCNSEFETNKYSKIIKCKNCKK